MFIAHTRLKISSSIRSDMNISLLTELDKKRGPVSYTHVVPGGTRKALSELRA